MTAYEIYFVEELTAFRKDAGKNHRAVIADKYGDKLAQPYQSELQVNESLEALARKLVAEVQGKVISLSFPQDRTLTMTIDSKFRKYGLNESQEYHFATIVDQEYQKLKAGNSVATQNYSLATAPEEPLR